MTKLVDDFKDGIYKDYLDNKIEINEFANIFLTISHSGFTAIIRTIRGRLERQYESYLHNLLIDVPGRLLTTYMEALNHALSLQRYLLGVVDFGEEAKTMKIWRKPVGW